MATYQPPTEILPIFDPNVFLSGDEVLTYNEASKLFLKYPSAQGTENLLITNVNGLLTANAGIVSNTLSSSAGNALTLQTKDNLNVTINSLILSTVSVSSPLPLQLNGVAGSSFIQTRAYSFYDLNTGVASNANIYYQSNGLNADCLTPNSNFIIVTQNGSSINTNALIVNSTNIRTLTPTIPSTLDSSDKIPTTAWVQNVISTLPNNKTYTTLYTTSQTIQLPVNCAGISVVAIGQGGASGNASNSVSVGLWNAGGTGSAGTTITSNGILPFKEGSFMDIIITPFLSELYATSIGATVCRANCGAVGGNASFGAGGLAGVSNNSWIVNNAMTSWNVQIGPSGPAGGSNLSFQTATYPATGGIPICNNWNPSVIYGCGQNWNGFTTTNSFQGPAIGILGGAIWITYYLK